MIKEAHSKGMEYPRLAQPLTVAPLLMKIIEIIETKDY